MSDVNEVKVEGKEEGTGTPAKISNVVGAFKSGAVKAAKVGLKVFKVTLAVLLALTLITVISFVTVDEHDRIAEVIYGPVAEPVVETIVQPVVSVAKTPLFGFIDVGLAKGEFEKVVTVYQGNTGTGEVPVYNNKIDHITLDKSVTTTDGVVTEAQFILTVYPKEGEPLVYVASR